MNHTFSEYLKITPYMDFEALGSYHSECLKNHNILSFNSYSNTPCGIAEWCEPSADFDHSDVISYADVKNHLSARRMREHMKSNIFTWHGYTLIYIKGRWVRATPAFNIELCEKFRLKPLEFDGEHDSIHHAFDEIGNQHMEYVRFRGEFADVPLEEIICTFSESGEFPIEAKKYDFDKDVIAERKNKRD